MQYDRVVCSGLRSLNIEFFDLDTQEFFCRTISLPALEDLQVGSTDVSYAVLSIDELASFLSHSSCSLKRLSISELAFEEGSLIRLVPVLTSLKQLRITDGYPFSSEGATDRDTFYHLIASLSHQQAQLLPSLDLEKPTLPSLEIFEWDSEYYYPWVTLPGLLQPLVADGTPCRRPLKSVKIVCSTKEKQSVPYIPRNVIQQLSEFPNVKFNFKVVFGTWQSVKVDWWKKSLEKSDNN